MELTIKQYSALTVLLGKFQLTKDFLDKSIEEFNAILEEPKPSQRDKTKSKTHDQEAMELILSVLDLMLVLFKAERKGVLP